jgi:hypothetical protein
MRSGRRIIGGIRIDLSVRFRPFGQTKNSSGSQAVDMKR